jgi:hypothetical protein
MKKMEIKYKIIILFTILLIATIFNTGCIEKNTVTYELTFNAAWSEKTHPDDFPQNPHFSGL